MNRLLPAFWTPPRTLIAALLGVVVTLSGCDVLEVDNPNNLIEEELQTPRSTPAMANGAEATVARALGAILAPYSTATDELTWIGSRDAWDQLDIGQLTDNSNEFSDAAYPYVAEARWTTREYIRLMEDFQAEGTLQNTRDLVRTYLYGAVIYAAIADMYDNFALSNRLEAASPLGEDNMDQLYDTALGFVDSALDLVDDGTPRALESALLGMRARILHGRAVWNTLNPAGGTAADNLIDNAEMVTAAQAALDVMPEDFVFEMELDGSAPDLVVGDLSMALQVNERAELGFGESYVEPEEDGTYTPDDEDSAIIYEDIITGEVHPRLVATIDGFVEARQYADVPVVSAREMHLILAEAALAGNPDVDFTTQINVIRNLDGLTAYSGQVDALELLIEARRVQLFLQGRRLADHYRFNDPSAEWTDRADPRGTFLPIAITEVRANPNL